VNEVAPFDRIPLFVRAGSILPLGPEMEWATEKPADPIELRIYPGADGDFTLYEDENDNYNYEKSAYATIPLHWDDANQTLTIGRRRGEFPGMLRQRTFNVVFVKENHGVGSAATAKPDLQAEYSGGALMLTRR
jgi:alpha-D-xyloside xylohydrolase